MTNQELRAYFKDLVSFLNTNHHLTTVKANELAVAFGGGGHAQAAGFLLR